MKNCALIAAFAAMSFGASRADTVAVDRVTYRMPNGATNVCLIQIPTNASPRSPLIIYMHGANHDERQGMQLFPILRQQVESHGWILVSPREYEYAGLKAKLVAMHGERPIYLAGASAGARASYREACRNPGSYAGAILIGPALEARNPPSAYRNLRTFIVYGDQDGLNTATASWVVAALNRVGAPVKELVIRGEGHEAPYGKQDWWYDTLTFVTGIACHAP